MKRMKAYLERSHLKLHTFWRDQAIYFKQPKVRMNAYESIRGVWKRMKAYLKRSHLKRHTFGRDQAIYI